MSYTKTERQMFLLWMDGQNHEVIRVVVDVSIHKIKKFFANKRRIGQLKRQYREGKLVTRKKTQPVRDPKADRYRIFRSDGSDTHCVVTANSPKEALLKARRVVPAYLLGRGVLKARRFRR